MEPTHEDDVVESESRLSGYRTPEVLGLAAFGLGIAALLGFGLLSGNIVLALSDAGPPTRGIQLLAGLLGAALVAIPLILGLEATRQLLEDDPLWVSAVARAAVVLGAVVVVLRLFHVLVQALSDGGQYIGF